MRLPPLNALRAFEAAARHDGFIGASDELNVTRGAISRQVKALEEHLGVALFTRYAQGVRLTSAGRQLQPVLAEAFRSIASEVNRLRSDALDLRIICPPATSIRWLIPRLEGFRQRYPTIVVRLTTDFYGHGGFDTMDYDLGFSVERWPGRPETTEATALFPVRMTPACSPDLLNRVGPLTSPEQLATFDLLHETPEHRDWRQWADVFDVRHLDVRGGQDFPNLDMATRAALMGAGFVMADLVLCREEFKAGLLVAPFPELVCDGSFGGVCLIGSRKRLQEPKIAAFREWVLEIVAEESGTFLFEAGPERA